MLPRTLHNGSFILDTPASSASSWTELDEVVSRMGERLPVLVHDHRMMGRKASNGFRKPYEVLVMKSSGRLIQEQAQTRATCIQHAGELGPAPLAAADLQHSSVSGQVP
ncbi:hypothetical protein D7W81_05470 [Corallococcus aberystwythensis]|uniref:Uncharacterized protein n=1 Tax=Corallococcus aberystwythensis TaxID=2316722 RepID=A0A3A8QVF9_9BACT|nr:hypothetical protein D7W81_05470 [Corallococcus aberystwythensis]